MNSLAVLTGTNRAQTRHLDLPKLMKFFRCTIISRLRVACVIREVIILLIYTTSLHTELNLLTRKQLYCFQTCEYRHEFQRQVENKWQHIEIKDDASINDTIQHDCKDISINVNLLEVLRKFVNYIGIFSNGETFIHIVQKT